MKPAVSIIWSPEIDYPDEAEYFSPDEAYPEYVFKHLSKKPNFVYRAVRNCLMQAGLDKENHDKPTWNPLGRVISPGSRVFVLCNFVYHKRGNESKEDFFAKCTNVSVVRAVIDYILLATGQKGSVSFGNAALQSCDYAKVLEDTGASKVLEFYKNYTKFRVNTSDLRTYIVKRDVLGKVISIIESEDSNLEVSIDLGANSLLEQLYSSDHWPRFRVSEYDERRTEAYHNLGKHIYILNRKVLDSDVIVSIPKLKTHEKVGVTGGIKGCVGGIARKDCLAHHRFGSLRFGGDEYPKDNFVYRWSSLFHHYINKRGITKSTNLLRIFDRVIRKLIRISGGIVAGSWVGNDTAWRMAIDIARIVKYGSPSGVLSKDPMRKHVIFTDGIIGGEGQGPLSPCPKKTGLLLYSDDIVAGDFVNCLAMGFDPDKLPIIKNAFSLDFFPLTNCKQSEIEVIFNGRFLFANELRNALMGLFKAPYGWQGHIELRK